jgi:hypothetical protein
MVLYPAISLVSINPAGSHDHTARDARALASGRLSFLLALEIAPIGRATADRHGIARVDLANEMEGLLFGIDIAEPGCTAPYGLGMIDVRPKYLVEDRGMYYVRRPGHKKIRIRETYKDPNGVVTSSFMAAYYKALDALDGKVVAEPPKVPREKTFYWLVRATWRTRRSWCLTLPIWKGIRIREHSTTLILSWE